MSTQNHIGTVWEVVGNTPLIKIKSLSEKTGCEIWGKAEFLNPGGSVKDRTAKFIIESAEKKGVLQPGFSIVEGTAGNTGIGFAMLGISRGYKVIITMPDNQAPEKFQMLEALGAEVRKFTPVPFANPNHFYHQARMISENESHTFWANQFENTANYQAHFSTTGPEIWEQTQGKLDAFITSVGTGGTLAGVSCFLKEKNKNVFVQLVDPYGSGLYQHFKTGEIKTEGGSITEGIGIMRITENYKLAQIDDATRVNDQEMISMLFHLSKHDGLFVGTSAALNVAAAYNYALQNKNSGKRIVTILGDSGTRYQSRLLNSQWLKEKGLESRLPLKD